MSRKDKEEIIGIIVWTVLAVGTTLTFLILLSQKQ